MNQYFFHLGRLYTLSIAELLSFFNEKDFKYINRNFALIETDISLSKDNGQSFINNIGGTKAVSRLIGKVANSSEFETLATDFLIENYGSNSKIIFGLNNYINSNYAISLQDLLKKIKSSLQKQDFHCRFVNNNSNNIETPIFFKERLNSEKGSELNLIEIENEIYLTETLSSQDIDSFSIRDFKKPFRDSKTGMLPPKLAKILINLSSTTRYIIDPFCGSGTILTEALLSGFNVIGSDISEIQTAGATTNINWLKANFDIQNTLSSEISIQDATCLQISSEIAKNSAIVSEGYLGPALKERISNSEIKQISNDILNLYKNFLQNAKKLGIRKIVICLPAYKENKNYIFIENFLETIQKIGFQNKQIFSNNLLNKFPLLTLSKRQTMIYDRPEQKVAREIFILNSN